MCLGHPSVCLYACRRLFPALFLICMFTGSVLPSLISYMHAHGIRSSPYMHDHAYFLYACLRDPFFPALFLSLCLIVDRRHVKLFFLFLFSLFHFWYASSCEAGFSLSSLLLTRCNGDVSYDEGSLQEVRTVTMTMTDVECLRLI